MLYIKGKSFTSPAHQLFDDTRSGIRKLYSCLISIIMSSASGKGHVVEFYYDVSIETTLRQRVRLIDDRYRVPLLT